MSQCAGMKFLFICLSKRGHPTTKQLLLAKRRSQQLLRSATHFSPFWHSAIVRFRRPLAFFHSFPRKIPLFSSSAFPATAIHDVARTFACPPLSDSDSGTVGIANALFTSSLPCSSSLRSRNLGTVNDLELLLNSHALMLAAEHLVLSTSLVVAHRGVHRTEQKRRIPLRSDPTTKDLTTRPCHSRRPSLICLAPIVCYTNSFGGQFITMHCSAC